MSLYYDTLPCATLRKTNQCILGKHYFLLQNIISEYHQTVKQFGSSSQFRSEFLLGLIWVQTVATTQTDKDLNISFCRHSIYFQKIINWTCAYILYHKCMRQIVSFDIFLICDAKSKGSTRTRQTQKTATQQLLSQKPMIL